MSKLFKLSALAIAVLTSGVAYANTNAPLPVVEPKAVGELDKTIANFDNQKVLNELEQNKAISQSDQALQNQAGSELVKQAGVTNIDTNSSPEEVYALLEQNPQAFEDLLLRSLSSSDSTALKVLLPAYERYPEKDPSVIDWGNALIALQNGESKKAVELYRKINAALPNIRLLRLQMASALYQNRQVNAAKSELQKLLREEMPDSERKMLNDYIEVMKRANKWNFSTNLSFVRDNNLEDAPPVGTKIGDSASNLTYTTPHQKGTGFNYSLGADKKWSYDNKLFTSFSAGVGGTYYVDNKKFNDLSANTSVGIGYQNATTEIEFAPTFAKSWYGGGTSSENDDSLKSYTQSVGARLSASKWVTPNVLLQHSTQATDVKYKEPYTNNNGDIYSMMNGVLYAPNARKYYGLQWNISKKDGKNPSDSYERSGVNFMWNNTWDKGITSTVNFGVASKKHKAANFAGIVRDNAEYTVGLSLWKRDWSVWGLTPRLNINTKKVSSNYAFDNTSETNANVVFTKTF